MFGAAWLEVVGDAPPPVPGAVTPPSLFGGIVVVVVVGDVTGDEGAAGSAGNDRPGLPELPVEPLLVLGADGDPAPVTGANSDVAPEMTLETDPMTEPPSGITSAVRTAVAGPEVRDDDVVSAVRAAADNWLELAHASTVPDAGVAGAEAALVAVEVAGVGEGTDASVRSGHADAAYVWWASPLTGVA